MNREIENFLSEAFGYSESTKVSYRRILNMLIELPNLDTLDAAGLIEFIKKPEWGNAQQNVAIFCSQKFLRWRYGSLHPALRAKIKRIKPKPRRRLSQKQAQALLAHFNPWTQSGARDLAIIAVGVDTGFRRNELCSLSLKNVDFYTNTASALCKGGEWGSGAFSPNTAAIIQQYLAFRKAAPGVDNLFVSLKGGQALTGNGMGCVFKRLTKAINFPISAHDLRASMATLAAEFGASSRAGQIAGRWKTQEEYEHYTATLQLDLIRPHLPMANLTKT